MIPEEAVPASRPSAAFGARPSPAAVAAMPHETLYSRFDQF
jgi:hypothetical protein